MAMAPHHVDGETLLARLNALFTEDPAIDEIGLLFGIEKDDLTPDVAFQLAEHKLGVAFSAGPLVFRAARTRFHVLNARLHSGEITEPTSEAAEELLACSRAVLLISADFYTGWNTRKEFVRRGWLQVPEEVTFSSLVFSLHPKSIDTWAYRRWLAMRFTPELMQADLVDFYDQQIKLCGVLTERFPRNYHAWSFRHWIVSRFHDKELLDRELAAMKKWCETHLKDHSGWNHRQHVIKCSLHQSPQVGFDLLVSELGFLSGILAKFPMYEALWCHRRFIWETLLSQTSPVDVSEASFAQAAEDALTRVQNKEIQSENEDRLQSEFAREQTSLRQPASVACTALQDVTTAWQCGNRFAKRFAAWLVQRLETHLPEPRASLLKRLNQTMRQSLTADDALLEHLWQAPRPAAH